MVPTPGALRRSSDDPDVPGTPISESALPTHEFTALELRLLTLLDQCPHRRVALDVLVPQVWGHSDQADDHFGKVDRAVARLRVKLRSLAPRARLRLSRRHRCVTWTPDPTG
jgi:DNA-binding response OmpR family regulator